MSLEELWPTEQPIWRRGCHYTTDDNGWCNKCGHQHTQTFAEAHQMKKPKSVDHGMLLDGKYVMDDALPTLQQIKELVPERLHDEFDELVARFESDLAQCDVQHLYVEKPRGS